MIIKIDYREKELYIQCIQLSVNLEDIKIETENLPIGDVIICDNNNNEKIIIERKSLNDLASSIRDGRYNEQSYRLNDCEIHNHNIIYLIEGLLIDYKPKITRVEKRSLLSSMVTLNYYKGFSVHRTNNIGETAEWIINLSDKLRREKKDGYYNKKEVLDKVTNDYAEVSKRAKKDNITVDNIGEIMLIQIPGVSSSIAKAIMKEHLNIKNLIENIEKNEKILDNIKITTKTGKERKISKTAINNIYSFLLGKELNIVVNTK